MGRDKNVGFFCLFCFYWTPTHPLCVRLEGAQINYFLPFLGYDLGLECVFITHKMLNMKKAKTNLTLDPKVKRKGELLARKNGLSFSALITTLLVRELAEHKKSCN